MFCGKCGTKLQDGAKFCVGCGAKVESGPKKEKVTKKAGGKVKIPGKVIAIVLVLALLAGAAVVVLPMVTRKTVYLMTESVTNIDEGKYTTHYEYNKDGQIVSYEYIIKDKMSGVSYKDSWEYEYKDGRIVSAEYETDGRDFRLEYEYDKKGNLKAVEGDGFEAEVECDKEGRILEVEIESDWIDYEASYTYHSNGMMKTLNISDGTREERCEFTENGDLKLVDVWINGRRYYYLERDYNKSGNLRRESEMYINYGSVTSQTEQTYKYDKQGNLTDYTLEREEYGDKVWLECEVVRRGNTEQFIITELTGEADVLGWNSAGMEEDEVYMEREYDKRGLLIREENIASAEVTEYEYIAIKVPRDYVTATIDDPQYFFDAGVN